MEDRQKTSHFRPLSSDQTSTLPWFSNSYNCVFVPSTGRRVFLRKHLPLILIIDERSQETTSFQKLAGYSGHNKVSLLCVEYGTKKKPRCWVLSYWLFKWLSGFVFMFSRHTWSQNGKKSVSITWDRHSIWEEAFWVKMPS